MNAMNRDPLGKALFALPRPRLGPAFNRRVLAALRAEAASRRALWTLPAEASALALASSWMAAVAWAAVFSATPGRLLRAAWLCAHPSEAAALAKLQLAKALLLSARAWSFAGSLCPSGGVGGGLILQWACAALLAGAILLAVSRDLKPHAAWRKS